MYCKLHATQGLSREETKWLLQSLIKESGELNHFWNSIWNPSNLNSFKFLWPISKIKRGATWHSKPGRIWNIFEWGKTEKIWKWFEIQIQNLLGVIWVLFKLFFSKNKIYRKEGKMIPYIRKLEINKFEIILVFLKWFYLGFTIAVALCALSKFWILFDARKNFMF